MSTADAVSLFTTSVNSALAKQKQDILSELQPNRQGSTSTCKESSMNSSCQHSKFEFKQEGTKIQFNFNSAWSLSFATCPNNSSPELGGILVVVSQRLIKVLVNSVPTMAVCNFEYFVALAKSVKFTATMLNAPPVTWILRHRGLAITVCKAGLRIMSDDNLQQDENASQTGEGDITSR
jgi:hypothetical protein